MCCLGGMIPRLVPVVRILSSGMEEGCRSRDISVVSEGSAIRVTRVSVRCKFDMGNITSLRARVLGRARLGGFCGVCPRGFGGGAGNVAFHH